MWKALGTVRKYLWRYRAGLALGGVCLVLKDLAQAMQPLMIRGAVDHFKDGGFLRYALLLLLMAALKGVFQYGMRVILTKAPARTLRHNDPLEDPFATFWEWSSPEDTEDYAVL